MYKFCPKCGNKFKKKKLYGRQRLICSKCEFIFYQNPKPCTAVIIQKNNKILLSKRAFSPWKDWWDLPGGFIEEGEDSESSAIREVKEETGLKIKIKKLLGIYIAIYPDKIYKCHLLVLTYLAKIIGGKLRPKDDVKQLKFFSFNRLPKKIASKAIRDSIRNFTRDRSQFRPITTPINAKLP